MTSRRHNLDVIADLLGLPRYMVRAVERRANGDYAVMLRGRLGPEVPRWAWPKRVVRIPARRVEGYRPSTPHVRPRDARARRKQNEWRMALWLAVRTGFDTPVVLRAFDGDLTGVADLREAIRAACPDPDVVFVYVAASNGSEAAA